MVKRANISLDDDNEEPINRKASMGPAKKSRSPKTNVAAVKRIMGEFSDSGQMWWKPKAGRNELRILPSNREDGLFFYPSILHYGFRDDTGAKRAYPCLASAFKKPCPACKVIGFYEGEADSDVEKAVNAMKPKRTYLMNIIDMANPKEVRIYSCSPSVAKPIIGAFGEDDYGDITDPIEGFNIIVIRTGEGISTRYETRFRRESSVIAMENWEESLHDLEKAAYREIPEYADYCELLQSAFGGVLPDIEKATKIAKTFKKGEKLNDDVDDLED